MTSVVSDVFFLKRGGVFEFRLFNDGLTYSQKKALNLLTMLKWEKLWTLSRFYRKTTQCCWRLGQHVRATFLCQVTSSSTPVFSRFHVFMVACELKLHRLWSFLLPNEVRFCYNSLFTQEHERVRKVDLDMNAFLCNFPLGRNLDGIYFAMQFLETCQKRLMGE